ncbi:Hsp20 family protein [Sphingomonas montana]|uniref:Hsp20 family protein n=1 Tax=Sphingomonas montana TaxID=1843236 RepID=UPI00096C13F7|nr:Hsp20 family protein [Sphingomonas montana]
MRANFDFTPYRRSSVGFDHLFDLLETGMRGDTGDSYPPFDIVADGPDRYRITLAVAGFRPDEIEIVAQQNQLTVVGRRSAEAQDVQYLHRGIAARPFERQFQLADFIEVGAADFANGLLSIELKRVVPEAMKPRKIAIGDGSATTGATTVRPADDRPANDRIAAPSEDSRAA